MDEIRYNYVPRLLLFEDDNSDGEGPGGYLEVMKELKIFLDASYKRPEGMYSRVRKMVTEKMNNIRLLTKLRDVIKQSKEEFDREKRAAKAVLEYRNRTQTVISMKYVLDVVDRLKTSECFADKAVLLMMSSGARKIEILDDNTSLFFRVGHRQWIKQIGVAKKRDPCDQPVIMKPLLFLDCEDFLSKLEDVRREVDSRDKQGRVSIGKTFAKRLENACAYLWPQNVANGYRTGTHLNRAIYANVAYRKFRMPGESLTHFVKHRLGHESMGSAANYMNISIAFDEDPDLMAEAQVQEWVVDQAGIEFNDEEGKLVKIRPAPIRKMTAEERMVEVEWYADQLQSNRIAITRGNLLALGLQSGIITASKVLENE